MSEERGAVAGATDGSRSRLLYELGCAFAAQVKLDDLVAVVLIKCREVLDAEAAAILLHDPERHELYFPYVADENAAVAARLHDLRFPDDHGIAGAVLHSGEPLRIADAATDPRFYGGVDRRTGLVTRNLLCVPLRSQQGTIGVIQVLNRRGDSGFSNDDLDFLDALAGSIAVAIENARLYAQLKEQVVVLERAVLEHNELLALRRELDIARSIQQSIVPRGFPERNDVRIFADMLPAQEVGGDFYDFFFIDADRLGVVIGDVSGKGIPAALFMAVTRTLLRSTALAGASPGECLHRVNALLISENTAEMFVTVFYGILNLRTGSLEYSNGGHNPPYLLRVDGTVEALPGTGGTVLGVLDEISFHTKAVALRRGDAIFLYTDGVTEAMDAAGNLFSDVRLESTLAEVKDSPPEDVIRAVVDAVKRYSENAPPSDDLTALAVRIGGRANAEKGATMRTPLTVTLKNQLTEIERVSHIIEAFGEERGLTPRTIFEINLALDEILTNIISYAHDNPGEHTITVRLSLVEHEVQIEVEDDGRPFSPLGVETPDVTGPLEDRPVGGLGLHLVRKLMSGLAYRREAGKNFFVMRKAVTS